MTIPRKGILLPLLLIIALSTASFATSVGIQTTTNQSYQGVLLNVTGAFSVQSNGFFVAQQAGTASSQPCTWSNGGNCQTALTAGDWYYKITITTGSGVPASATFTVTVQWNTGSGYVQLGSLTFSTGTTAPPSGQTMTFLFDTGSGSFSAPTGIVVTVA